MAVGLAANRAPAVDLEAQEAVAFAVAELNVAVVRAAENEWKEADCGATAGVRMPAECLADGRMAVVDVGTTADFPENGGMTVEIPENEGMAVETHVDEGMGCESLEGEGTAADCLEHGGTNDEVAEGGEGEMPHGGRAAVDSRADHLPYPACLCCHSLQSPPFP